MLGSGAGLFSILLSNTFDTQTGPTIILLLGACFIVSLVFRPAR